MAGAGAEESAVLLAGPWIHREITANGGRFHAAELGEGPLVLLLHGFPQFWWCWRHALVALAEAGFRAVAPDLRGYGASDKPPRGYDAVTLAADCAGMVKALGERDAVVAGTDWGGVLGWSMAALHPSVVRRLVVLSAPHPLRLRGGVVGNWRGSLTAARYVLGFQTPRLAERYLTQEDGAAVERLLSRWSSPGWPDAEAAGRYRQAMQIPGVAHSSLEYYRWAVRSSMRTDGLRYARAMAQPVAVPTLQVHGEYDGLLPLATAAGSGQWVDAAYEWHPLVGVGHFPAEEAPEQVNALLVRWAGEGDGT